MSDNASGSSIRGDNPPARLLLKGKCDVCTKPDEFQGHILLKCKQCGVLVHELCYGLDPKGKHDPNFICLACKCIGASIEVNNPSIIGGCGEDTGKKREFMTQMERPKECVLCNHHEGIHAMHPLYDAHGPDGRQYVLPQMGDLAHRKEKRLAWVHTLCASFLGDYFQSEGGVYGCDIYGNYDHDDESDDEQEDENGTEVSKYFLDEKLGKKRPFTGEIVNYFPQKKRYRVRYDEDGEEEDLTEKQIAKIQGRPHEKLMNVHHFVVDTKSEFIRGLRNLKCIICKSTNGKLRIPVQCTAGTDNVLDCFPNSLRANDFDKKTGNQGCLRAMHVGCARWKAREKYACYKGKAVRLCYYYPGQKVNFEEEWDGKTKIITKDPKSNIFCRVHCHEIINSQINSS
ncbi:hypothetical protein ACHAXS_010170 [Conticribra weissflogii]